MLICTNLTNKNKNLPEFREVSSVKLKRMNKNTANYSSLELYLNLRQEHVIINIDMGFDMRLVVYL